MSRIGNLPITIPSGVSIHVDDKSHEVTIKGPRGELKQIMDPSITLEWENDILHVRRQTEQKRHKALHGLYRSLVANMVKGVSEGFTTIQELVGTGYKAQATNQVLTLSLGYSHNIIFQLPEEIKVETITEKGKNPVIQLTSCDKQLLGQVAAKIRSYRKPEPYKGKGIRFKGEDVRRKAGKSAEK
ncbi:MAG: 50S ribosomal protein L6 [Bacteroidales bacterium]|jgi:large subunit ribosomal protein L6|nr:50S ribosomal protein L6 [Bacteroidales bacterium]MDD2687076.1 50S ribosomal protein L6 [Bacteroidales bacterium]MDD3330660.1 50S ribosomal protein L6 [Bacteroidales bacterium]MDD3691527.1 50S ribosomal protein L6 [Bacteroidales bacterium]MDD4044987.1 50S ribosomal protein L6 [Bacteroidales bacterium]